MDHWSVMAAVNQLKKQGIEVAIELGVHSLCRLDSNCPKAIEVRKIITDSGTELGEYIQERGFTVSPLPEELKATVVIHHPLLVERELDITEFLRPEAQRGLERAIKESNKAIDHCKVWLEGCINRYNHEVYRLRQNSTLPQLPISARELLRLGAVLGKHDKNLYNIYFRVTYSPVQTVRAGVRYQLSNEDVLRIRREGYLGIVFNKHFEKADLWDEHMNKLSHYHGNAYDCWGNGGLPDIWDGTIEQLVSLRDRLMRALGTINGDSLMLDSPLNMPTYQTLLQRATRIGPEGRIEQTPSIAVPPVGWTTGGEEEEEEGEWEEGEEEDQGDPDPVYTAPNPPAQVRRRWGGR